MNYSCIGKYSVKWDWNTKIKMQLQIFFCPILNDIVCFSSLMSRRFTNYGRRCAENCSSSLHIDAFWQYLIQCQFNDCSYILPHKSRRRWRISYIEQTFLNSWHIWIDKAGNHLTLTRSCKNAVLCIVIRNIHKSLIQTSNCLICTYNKMNQVWVYVCKHCT